MGMISKRVHQRTTNRIAEPIRAVSKLDLDQVLGALRRVVDETPAKTGLLSGGERLWLIGQAPGPWRVYYGPPGRREPDKPVRVWFAQVSLQPSSDGSETLVTTALGQWKTRDGKLVARREYEQFCADFTRALAAADPSFSVLGVA